MVSYIWDVFLFYIFYSFFLWMDMNQLFVGPFNYFGIGSYLGIGREQEDSIGDVE